jgi:hypothetical protein
MTYCLCGGDTHGEGCKALVHPSKIESLQPEMLGKHQILAFLEKTICCFQVVHDFHPDGIARLNLPDSTWQTASIIS